MATRLPLPEALQRGGQRPDLLERLENRASRVDRLVLGRNPARVAVGVVRRFVEVRVTGLAAEMTYFAALSVLPLLSALGASLGLVERLLGPDQVADMRQATVDSVGLVLSEELTSDLVSPLISELLTQERVGVAVSSLVVALWLGSRVFRAAIRALDDAYGVTDRRSVVQQYLLSLAFALGSVLVVTVLLGVVVVGPLLGAGQALADRLGAESSYTLLWQLGRWPLIGVACVAWLTWLYLVGPNVDNSWRSALPGAALATLGLVLVTVGFRVYLDLAGPQGPEVQSGPEAVLVVGRFLGAALASLVYAWVASTAVLLGGVVNAEWARRD